ncbi:hypothetical protein UA08_08293 [Talaromyces atroroseus]|uniref:Aminotransferase class I/classII large domain-containing protein n=1 Tax=Talaromyces atroroseus TaxID=1441469 RepID=A0A225A9E6_TALAT|nr:hypothetical protein UA08_08293 [Talaromyces atroroseus]OKL56660.1 hypothetical protein UA08_08293 [Talaromyces atroroseus]
MLSSRCKQRNEDLIPSLLSQHDAVLTGDMTTIDLSTAENWPVKVKVLDTLQDEHGQLSESDFAYSSGIGGCSKTRALLADLLNTHFRPTRTVESSHIILAAGGSFALTALIEQICNPGDGVLIASPYWAGLDISISIHSHAIITPVHVPLKEFFSVSSISYYESAIGQSSVPIRAVLICNPHNPLGQCYPQETLRAMLDFFLELGDSQMSDQIHVVYSLSKDFGCNGMRLGALISQSAKAIRLSAALSLHSQVSSLSTALASRLISSVEKVQQITEYGGTELKVAYMIMRSFLEARRMEFVPVAYGMFVFARLLQLQSTAEDQELLKHLKSAGISVSTGSSYHFTQPGWFRICYGVPHEQLQEGLRRLDAGVQNYLKEVTHL